MSEEDEQGTGHPPGRRSADGIADEERAKRARVGRGKEAMKIDRHNENPGGLDGRENERGYVAPQIQTFTAEEFMNVLGPAQGYGGGGGTEENPVGRGFRLFPGLR
jgi:hypothetical protein